MVASLSPPDPSRSHRRFLATGLVITAWSQTLPAFIVVFVTVAAVIPAIVAWLRYRHHHRPCQDRSRRCRRHGHPVILFIVVVVAPTSRPHDCPPRRRTHIATSRLPSSSSSDRHRYRPLHRRCPSRRCRRFCHRRRSADTDRSVLVVSLVVVVTALVVDGHRHRNPSLLLQIPPHNRRPRHHHRRKLESESSRPSDKHGNKPIGTLTDAHVQTRKRLPVASHRAVPRSCRRCCSCQESPDKARMSADFSKIAESTPVFQPPPALRYDDLGKMSSTQATLTHGVPSERCFAHSSRQWLHL